MLDVVALTFSNFSMPTNWELCLYCKEKKRNEKERREISSYSQIETQVKNLIEIDPTYVELGRLNDGTGMAKTLETHSAVHHKKCYDKIGPKIYNQLLAKVGKKPYSKANSSSSTVIPHKGTKTELGTESCIFCGETDSTENLCAGGEFYSGSSTNN